ERRDLTLKSSYLSRYKTWVQMCGVGVLMLLSCATPTFMDWFLGALALLPVVGYVALRVLARRRWKGAGWFAISFATVLLIHRSLGGHVTAVALMYFIVGVTWASGLGYLFSVGQLRGRGRVAGAGDGRAGGGVRAEAPLRPRRSAGARAQARDRKDRRRGVTSRWCPRSRVRCAM